MKWRDKFIEDYGSMVVFMTISVFLGTTMIVAGCLVEALGDKLIGPGITLLIGTATLAGNKSRTTRPSNGATEPLNKPE